MEKVKLDVKNLLLKILPIILPVILEQIPAEKIGKLVKEKLVGLVGAEAAIILSKVIAGLLEDVVRGLRS